MLSKKRI